MGYKAEQIVDKHGSYSSHRTKKHIKKASSKKHRREGKRGEKSLYNRYEGWLD